MKIICEECRTEQVKRFKEIGKKIEKEINKTA